MAQMNLCTDIEMAWLPIAVVTHVALWRVQARLVILLVRPMCSVSLCVGAIA